MLYFYRQLNKLMKSFLTIIICTFCFVSTRAQANSEKLPAGSNQNYQSNNIEAIYSAVEDYYFNELIEDTSGNILIVDTSVVFYARGIEHLCLMGMNIARKFKGASNLINIYNDYLQVDTSDIDSIKDFNERFQNTTDSLLYLGGYFSESERFKLIDQNQLDSAFAAFEQIRIEAGYSQSQIDSVMNIANLCWAEFHEYYNCIGYCKMSAPFVINEDTAIIYLSSQYHSLAGESLLLILIRDQARWIVNKEIVVGMS